MIPRGCRVLSTRHSSLIHDRIQIGAEALEVDTGRTGEHCGREIGCDEPLVSDRVQLAYRDAVAGDHEGLAAIQRTHDRSAFVP